LPSLLGESVLVPPRARLDELVYQTLVAGDADPCQDVEERGVADAALGLPDPVFAPCREHRLLAEAAVFGPDWHLGGLGPRAPLPGCGHQGLHLDYFPGHRTRGQRWPVERANSWHNAFNRLQCCYERREDVIDAFLDLADTIITVRSLIRQARITYRRDGRPARRP
jgi:hypothetical protein